MEKIASYIDHTALKPNVGRDDIVKLCNEAKKYNFATVCVNSVWVDFCYSLLNDSNVKICTVVGFPLGANLSEIKAFEARQAFKCGANEIDMVLNVGLLKDRMLASVANDIFEVREAVPSAVLKVIIETCLLDVAEIPLACKIAKEAGADFVKTSTGFSTGGATLEDIALMRLVVGKSMGVKASGGISDFETAQAMIRAGASRLGCSAGVVIAKDEKKFLEKNK